MKRWQSVALRGALLYALVAGLWIATTDRLLGWLAPSLAGYVVASTVKGFVFVLVTSLLLYLALRRVLRRAYESQQRYQAIFEAANDGIFILERDRFVDCNQRALELFGATREELLGLAPADLSPERQPDGQLSAEIQRERNQRALAGEAQSFQWQHRRRDGTEFAAEISLRSYRLGSRQLLLALVRDVTERVKAQAAVRESEEKLRRLYTSMNEGLALHEVIYDALGEAMDYRILDVNPAFETITGLSREKVVGQISTAAYGTDHAPYLALYAPVAAGGEPTSFEVYFEPMDKDFTVSVFSPRPGQFATVFSDITKRKEAERQLHLLNRVYALVSHINEAIVRISDRETLLRETCRITVEQGQFRMAWIGLVDESGQELRPAASAGHDEGYVATAHIEAGPTPRGSGPVGSAFREGRVVICDDIAHDPKMAPWREAALARGYRSLVGLPLRMNGRVIGALTVYSGEPGSFPALVTEALIEVTADLSFALELCERSRQRETEQQQLRLQQSALEAAANAIVITDRGGVIQWVNEAFTRLTGYRRDEAIGGHLRLIRSGVQDESFYDQMWQTVLAGGVWHGELTNRRKDGTLYEEEMTLTPVRSIQGEITHCIAIKQDVTERKKLERQFLRAQRMQSIGLLAGGVAHDLNNVLAPVLMALPLLRGELPPEQRRQILDTLEHSVQRGANIVQQVLTFARGIEVQRAPVQLRHLIREVARIAEETFPRDILVRVSAPANLWPFLGDPTQIHQVLLNLAVNARDAMPGGGTLSFTARNTELPAPRQFLEFEIPPGRYVSVSVEDTGTGIAPEVLEHIFEPFYTTKPAGKGTGLGLSTVLGIVKSHGGLVEVTSRPGAGSIFSVYLPAAPAEAVAQTPSPPSALPQGRGETVLVVDDEAGILHVSRSMLEANGYRVLTAKDGKEALARLSEPGGGIAAVVTDIMMPLMDGVALSRALQQQHPSVPVLVATGLTHAPGDPDRIGQLRELGVKYFLVKPFQAEELLNTLYEALHLA